ncbi:type II toxin-antitoxin system VapC family toxin [Candidatus Nitronereus thalassa]|uniref:Ribonuclease VapC n=1 Tax=Candidatus Nitronereus thalassa TaxID=3020898 RepID=A0ABU3KAJ1_9BACT|nr:type II toxin-antitoxin system VapC family toxin [Candidatus Nitronereus thalassa]MDT7043484.1 type II toxin-antitoxin system VapC family toxin [Candidatus Nitronereus thalassa]
MPFVLDSSVALAWVLPDESDPSIDRLCDRLTDDVAVVPPVWPLEIGNVLRIAVKRGRLNAKDMGRVIKELWALPIEIDATSTERSFEETLTLAQKFDLTTYDASYVELAQRRDVPLATLDHKLRKACLAAKITVLPS